MRKFVIVSLAIIALGVSATAIGFYWKAQQSVQGAIVTLKGVVVKDFHDPESARFRSISLRSIDGSISDRLHSGQVMKLLWQGTPTEAISILQYNPKYFELCGEVNAKNSFGAYVGYRRFYVSAIGSQTPSFDVGEADRFVGKMCDITNDAVILTEG